MLSKKWLYFMILLFLVQNPICYSYPLMMPENCLKNQKAPCLVRLKKNERLDYKNLTFTAVKESVLKVTDFKIMSAELNQGRLIVEFENKEASLFFYELSFTQGPMYLERQGDKTIIMGGENYKSIEFDESQSPIHIKTRVLDKVAFVEHLSKYYSNKQQLKSVLQQIFPVYLSTYRADLEEQKQKMQRSIASVEYREKQERLKQAEIKAQRQNSRDTFFQRTFNQ